MRINKICSSKKNKLVLSTYQENPPKQSLIDNCLLLVGISNSLEKRCSIIRNSKSKSSLFAKETQSNSNKENYGPQVRIRTTSTAQQLKLNQNYSSKVQLQRSKSRIKCPQPQPTLNSLISELIEMLKSKSIISQNHLFFYIIKKDHFHTLISQLLQSRKNHLSHEQQKYQGSLFSFLTQKIKEVQKLLQYPNQQNQKKYKLDSNLIQIQYNSSLYKDEVVKYKNQLQIIKDQKKRLQSQLQNLYQKKEKITVQLILKEREIAEQVKDINNNNVEKTKLTFQIKEMIQEIQTYKDILNKTKEKTNQLYNYINEQNNKHLLMASKDYKDIQSQIYQYASYLQCNQLASSLEYEPLSITCITEDLQNQIRNVNKTIIQNEELTLLDKSRIMRDFLMQWMNKFIRKDEQQKHWIDFKTKCVRTFIQKMKKWIDNWSFKQEYLVNLRNQFAFDSSKMITLLKSLQQQSKCDKCSSPIASIGIQISQLYQKIETNYKLGNSFY